MARFYTFEEWLRAHPELKNTIDECPHCDWLGRMECPECHGTPVYEIQCVTCWDKGEVECHYCMRNLRAEYDKQIRGDTKRYQLAMRAAR